MAGVCIMNSIDDEISAHNAAIAELKHQIEERRAAIRVLVSKKNALLPVGTLPNEVLCDIFLCLISLDPEDDPLVLAPGWIIVSHVCRRWRSVALSNPNLWTQISTFYISGCWLNTMLERSASAELSVRISYESEVTWHWKHLRKLEQIFGDHWNGERIAHLWLDTMAAETQAILAALPTSAPRLRSLRLIGSDPEYWSTSTNWRRLQEPAPVLPSNCLLNTHSLRELHLSYCSIAWDSHLLRNLTSIRICEIPRNNRPTPNQLYDVLSNLTDLVDLKLDNALPINDKNGKAYFPKMYFHRLTRLFISSDLSEVQGFFRSITISTSTSVNVTAKTSTPSAREFVGLISDVTDCYTSPISDIKFCSFRVGSHNLGSKRSMFFQLGNVPITEDNYNILDDSPFHWSLSYGDNMRKETGPEFPDENILLSCFWDSKMFDLRQVTCIQLLYPKITSSTLQHTVGTLPVASYISISEYNLRDSSENDGISPSTSRGFLSALSNDGLSLDSTQTISFLPKLTTIHFAFVRFKSTHKSTLTGYDIDVKDLRDCLIKRAAYAPSIRRIIMHNCFGVEEADVEYLRETIESVEWDRVDWGVVLRAVDDMIMSDYDDEDEDEDEESWDSSYHDGGSDMYSDD